MGRVERDSGSEFLRGVLLWGLEDAPPLIALLGLSELALHDLAHRVARQHIDEVDLARALVSSEQGGHVVDQLLGRWRCAGLGHNPRDDPLAEVVVRPPVTATSQTAGCSSSAPSISPAPIRNPPDLIRSVLLRPTSRIEPASLRIAMSPVLNQPSRNASAVASGRFRYR